VSLPEQLLLSDLLRRRVRCDQGLDHGAGVIGWMHPPVHRLLGWVSRPSALSRRRLVWRLDQLRGLGELEALVQGPGAETEPAILERLPTLLGAVLLGADGVLLGSVSDAAVELRNGRIRHYLVSRSDPRLPGSSRWRLSPERIVDQQPGQVVTSLQGLDDLPLARASVRQEFLRRSRRWRDQMGEETNRLRDRFQQASGRFEERLEGWLEEPPWDGLEPPMGRTEGFWGGRDEDDVPATSLRRPLDGEPADPDPLEDWSLEEGASARDWPESRDWSARERGPEPVDRAESEDDRDEPWPMRRPEPEPWSPRPEQQASGGDGTDWGRSERSQAGRSRRSEERQERFRGRDDEDDPWI